jgi:hypothetical protein
MRRKWLLFVLLVFAISQAAFAQLLERALTVQRHKSENAGWSPTPLRLHSGNQRFISTSSSYKANHNDSTPSSSYGHAISQASFPQVLDKASNFHRHENENRSRQTPLYSGTENFIRDPTSEKAAHDCSKPSSPHDFSYAKAHISPDVRPNQNLTDCFQGSLDFSLRDCLFSIIPSGFIMIFWNAASGVWNFVKTLRFSEPNLPLKDDPLMKNLMVKSSKLFATSNASKLQHR